MLLAYGPILLWVIIVWACVIGALNAIGSSGRFGISVWRIWFGHFLLLGLVGVLSVNFLIVIILVVPIYVVFVRYFLIKKLFRWVSWTDVAYLVMAASTAVLWVLANLNLGWLSMPRFLSGWIFAAGALHIILHAAVLSCRPNIGFKVLWISNVLMLTAGAFSIGFGDGPSYVVFSKVFQHDVIQGLLINFVVKNIGYELYIEWYNISLHLPYIFSAIVILRKVFSCTPAKTVTGDHLGKAGA